MNPGVGDRFGRLTVVEVTRNARGDIRYASQCECGSDPILHSHASLRTAEKNGSGCQRCRVYKKKHGRAHDRTYVSYHSMLQRCTNPKASRYARYGGRGIKVCDRWLESFENFLADMGDRPDGLTLERIDNEKGYEPGNCKWATHEEQSANTSKCRSITVGKVEYPSIAAACRAYCVKIQTYNYRRKSGQTIEQALRVE